MAGTSCLRKVMSQGHALWPITVTLLVTRETRRHVCTESHVLTCERETVQAKTVSWCQSLVRPPGPTADSRFETLQPGLVTAASKLLEALKSSAAVTDLLKPLYVMDTPPGELPDRKLAMPAREAYITSLSYR